METVLKNTTKGRPQTTVQVPDSSDKAIGKLKVIALGPLIIGIPIYCIYELGNLSDVAKHEQLISTVALLGGSLLALSSLGLGPSDASSSGSTSGNLPYVKISAAAFPLGYLITRAIFKQKISTSVYFGVGLSLIAYGYHMYNKKKGQASYGVNEKQKLSEATNAPTAVPATTTK